jgi:hypothetical protein
MITVPAPSTPSQPVMAARSRPEWATLGTGPYVAVKNFTGIGAKRLGGTVLINYTRDTSSHHTCNKAQDGRAYGRFGLDNAFLGWVWRSVLVSSRVLSENSARAEGTELAAKNTRSMLRKEKIS